MRDRQAPRNVAHCIPMSGIGDRIRFVRKREGLTQEALASLCGWEGNSRIGNYEKGLREPNAADMQLIAKATNSNAAWLWTGEGQAETGTKVPSQLRHIGADVPVVDLSTLADALVSQSPWPATMANHWMPCPVNHGQKTIAFQMPDTSMATTTDQSIPAGHYVWVDLERRDAEHDSPVLARLATGQHVVAQFMRQAGREWIYMLNPAYLPVTEPFEVVGKVIFSGRVR